MQETTERDLLMEELRSLNERKRKYMGGLLTVLQLVGFLEHAYHQEHGESMLATLPDELTDAYRRTLMTMATKQSQDDVRDVVQDGMRQAEEAGEKPDMTVDEIQERLLQSTGVKGAYEHRRQLRELRNRIFDNLPDGPAKELIRQRLGDNDDTDDEPFQTAQGVQA